MKKLSITNNEYFYLAINTKSAICIILDICIISNELIIYFLRLLLSLLLLVKTFQNIFSNDFKLLIFLLLFLKWFNLIIDQELQIGLILLHTGNLHFFMIDFLITILVPSLIELWRVKYLWYFGLEVFSLKYPESILKTK